jgi:putative phosphoribosyl transferase
LILGRLLKGRFHIKFKDRTSAGEILASVLNDFYKKQKKVAPITVLAIPRGGVIVGDAIVSKFNQYEFDIVIPRKLGAPNNPELAIGAVMQDRTAYLNESVIQMLQVPSEYIDEEISRQVLEVQRRMSLYRDPSKPYNIAGRSVVIVDDGIATGATAIVVVRWIKKFSPANVLIAVPVAPGDTVTKITREGAEVQVVTTPYSFGSVGQFYESFNQVTDEEVREISRKWGLLNGT